MPIEIDEFVTEVTTESESEGASPVAAQSAPWLDQMRVREALIRTQRDRSRTAAEGFDD
jgi:hypothetical protein